MLIQVLPQLAYKALIIQDVKDAVAEGKIVTIRGRRRKRNLKYVKGF
jgi:hypothetical protein